MPVDSAPPMADPPAEVAAVRVSDAAVASPEPASVLVVYFAKEHPLRETIDHSLYALQRHTPHRCVYLNLAVRPVPRDLLRERFDLVVFHTTFLSCRWNPPAFERLLERAAPLSGLGRARAAMPQDEFIHTDLLEQFLTRFDITHLFTAASQSLWSQIYPGACSSGVEVHQVLTGYLDPQWVQSLQTADAWNRDRPIDLGYRAKAVPYWLGDHGRLKVSIADAVTPVANERGLVTDISLKPQDTFLGAEWTAFLLRCKWVLGVEGGASILDADGSLRQRVDAFVTEHPDADYDTVRRACFAGMDGGLDLRAISPRHLEACATRTAQLLVEGEYTGILRSGEHYVPIKRDYSNVEEALEIAGDEDVRAAMVERCFQDIVASGRFGADRFALGLVEVCLGPDEPRSGGAWSDERIAQACRQDDRSWSLVRLRQRALSALRATGLEGPIKSAFGRR